MNVNDGFRLMEFVLQTGILALQPPVLFGEPRDPFPRLLYRAQGVAEDPVQRTFLKVYFPILFID